MVNRIKTKYKRVNNAGVNETPASFIQRITINSDDNVLEFVAFNSGIYTYKYTVSKTKLGKTVTFTEDHLKKFIESNATVGLGKNATTLQK